ncbi:MAG: molecular chaperone DnaJ [Patescibacteria group bacterium]|nr:molecular chaperone DnaJ [Patescibacteria group bacterium]
MSKDYYKVLGVEKTATADEIKRAFLKLAHQYHPDKNGGKDDKFKEINEAYQVLGNAEKRKQFDQFGANFNGAGGFGGGQGYGGFGGFQNGGMNINMDDLGDLGEMFGGLGDIFGFGSARGGQGRRREPQRGSDIEAAMTIDFLEAVFGAEKEVTLKKKITCAHCGGTGAEPGAKIEECPTCKGHGRVRRVQQTILGSIQTEASCPSCGGEGKIASKKCSECNGAGTAYDTAKFKVRIPAGVDDGGRIRIPGYGEAGDRGAGVGDLYLNIRVRPSDKFARDEYDILTKKEISFTQAALGDKIEIETVHGKVELKIPEGTQSGTVFKLKNKGVPHTSGRNIGDHLIEVVVKTPKNLNKRQKESLKELGI